MTTSWDRRLLARGIVANLAGAGAPALLGLLALPYVATVLGPARLGVLALAWSLLSSLGVLHLGVGRALAQVAASGRRERALGRLAWTGVLAAGAAGVLGGAALFAAAGALAGVLRVPPALAAEAEAVFRILAFAVPFAVSAPALSGLLEARGRFGRLNLVASAVSAATYLGPVAVLWAGGGLPEVALALAAARAAAWCGYLALAAAEYPRLRRPGRLTRAGLWALLRFGGWTTVSALVAPVMAYLDRFVVAAAVSATAVAFYAAPQEVVLRMGAVSGAVAGVLFPAFAAAGAGPPARLPALLERGAEAVFVLAFPLALLVVSFAPEALAAWLGPEYAAGGAAALRWMGAGVLVNGLAKPAAALLTGHGRPELPARLHLVELPLYVAALAVLVAWRGVEGAAMAWTLRAAADGVALYWVVCRVAPGAGQAARRVAWLAAMGCAALAVGAALGGVVPRAGWAAAALAATAAYALRRFSGPAAARAPGPDR